VRRIAARWVVVALNGLCGLVDRFAYHPAVIRATRVLPRWWRCDLGRLAVFLDDKWEVGYWGDYSGPVDMCAFCRRRASWLCIGDPEVGPEVPVCRYCHPEEDEVEMAQRALLDQP
jgi:hypothetical protein